MKREAHYPVGLIRIKTFTATTGAQQVSIDNKFLGPFSDRIPLTFVKNTAFLGFTRTNPFHFHNYDMTNLVCS